MGAADRRLLKVCSVFWFFLGGRRTNIKTKLKRLFSLFVIASLCILLAYCSDKTIKATVMNTQTMTYFS